jgi:hypothetical protein
VNLRAMPAERSNHHNAPAGEVCLADSLSVESKNGSTGRDDGQATPMCYNRPRRRGDRSDVPTNTPPPYFPQNQLSPGDEKTARKLRLTFYGCGVLLVAAVVAVIIAVVYLIRSHM